MAVSLEHYRPTLIDEHLHMLDVDGDGDKDATLCRAAATAMALDAMTLGEWTRTSKGDRWGKARIRTLLARMRNATGEPRRAGYNQSHVPDFIKGAGFPTDILRIYNKPTSDIKDKLAAGFVATVAGDVALTPAGSPLRKYVNGNVGHEIILTRMIKDRSKIAFIDPMTPHGTAKYERWAPANDVHRFMGRFRSNGNNIAEIWKRGKLTEAKEVARDRARVILEQQQSFLELKKLWERQQLELMQQDDTIAELQAKLDAAEEHEALDLTAELQAIELSVGGIRNKTQRHNGTTG
jgi:hypothetical protein